MTCPARITLNRPSGAERVRGFQPPWRTVYIYHCPACGQTRRVRANAFRGTTPQPGVGAIICGALLHS